MSNDADATDRPCVDDTDAALMVQFLSRHDAFCPLCKYNLRGLTRPKCPECGRTLTLSVGLVEPYLRAWIVLMVSLCVTAGPGLLFSVAIGAYFVRHGVASLTLSLLQLIPVLILIFCIPLAIAALLLRRRFLKLTRRTQWMLARISLLTTIITYLVLFIAVAAQ